MCALAFAAGAFQPVLAKPKENEGRQRLSPHPDDTTGTKVCFSIGNVRQAES